MKFTSKTLNIEVTIVKCGALSIHAFSNHFPASSHSRGNSMEIRSCKEEEGLMLKREP